MTRARVLALAALALLGWAAIVAAVASSITVLTALSGVALDLGDGALLLCQQLGP